MDADAAATDGDQSEHGCEADAESAGGGSPRRLARSNLLDPSIRNQGGLHSFAARCCCWVAFVARAGELRSKVAFTTRAAPSTAVR